MKKVSVRQYYILLKEGKIPKKITVDGEKYFFRDNRWYSSKTRKPSKNPFYYYRCKKPGCDLAVKGDNKEFCSKHTDWTRVSHGGVYPY